MTELAVSLDLIHLIINGNPTFPFVIGDRNRNNDGKKGNSVLHSAVSSGKPGDLPH
ncbi:hypothetical protein [Parabacteroides sp. FAFU027]|uniref:hypothetical protein n=1 Tax=Parabacteroides sp. FAFU027 TaxID=2922715 RepID=UPI001FAF78DE|nr:hypothetical protein [Parabacteroides sp. FAFU027]